MFTIHEYTDPRPSGSTAHHDADPHHGQKGCGGKNRRRHLPRNTASRYGPRRVRPTTTGCRRSVPGTMSPRGARIPMLRSVAPGQSRPSWRPDVTRQASFRGTCPSVGSSLYLQCGFLPTVFLCHAGSPQRADHRGFTGSPDPLTALSPAAMNFAASPRRTIPLRSRASSVRPR